MLRDRAIKVTMEKNKEKQTADTEADVKSFEEKTAFVLSSLENLATKAFVGFCIYVVLDTYRQTKIAEVMYQQN